MGEISSVIRTVTVEIAIDDQKKLEEGFCCLASSSLIGRTRQARAHEKKTIININIATSIFFSLNIFSQNHSV